MCYLTDIDPFGEELQENTCINCDNPTDNGSYCSEDCKYDYNR